jgi:heme-degrading monooxygenase HmoA
MFFRIDTLAIPDSARAEFDLQSGRTLELLSHQPGFIEQRVFEKVAGTGSVDVVTMVSWESMASIEAAGQAVRAFHVEIGFDAADFRKRNGIVDSAAVYEAS